MEKLNSILQEQIDTFLKNQAISSELNLFLKKISSSYDVYQKELGENRMDLEECKRKLAETEESLVKVNKEIDRFVYSVSHDLRAPMATLSGLLNLARTENNTGAIEHYLMLMGNSIEKMEHFIMNLLNYSRSNRQENDPVRIDFKQVVEQTTSSLRHLPNAFDIHFLTEYQLMFPFCTDLQKLQIIFTNLLSNAIQFHNLRQKQPYIKFSVVCCKEKAVIQIQDNGQGIEEKYHEKVFDMFFRGNELSKGNGLGLYIVKEMVQKLGGQIHLTSAFGEGTTFTLVLPNMFRNVAAPVEEVNRLSAY